MTSAENKHPLDSSTLFGKFYFTWLNKSIKKGSEEPWTQSMHTDLPKNDSFKRNYLRLKRSLNQQIRTSLLSAIFGELRWSLYYLSVVAAINSLMSLISIICMKELINTLQSNNSKEIRENILPVIGYMAFIGFESYVSVLLINQVTFNALKACNIIQAALYGIILDKAMKYNLLNSSEHSIGAILNYIQIDIPKFSTVLTLIFNILSSVLLLICYYSYLIVLIGNTTWIIIATVLLLSTINVYLFKAQVYFRKKQLIAKDKRMQFLKNIVGNLRYIKMRAWEMIYHYRLYFLREREITYLQIKAFLTAGTFFFSWLTPWAGLICVVAYQAYVMEGVYEYENLSALIRMAGNSIQAVNSIPDNTSQLMDWFVSLRRIESFLLEEDIKMDWIQEIEKAEQDGIAIRLTNGDFYWNSPVKEMTKISNAKQKMIHTKKKNSRTPLIEVSSKLTKVESSSITFSLSDIDFEIPRGKLVFIIGKVAAGKSSLLYSLLGEMKFNTRSTPSLMRDKNIAVLTQNPWILGDTIKENILLGAPFQEDRFNTAIRLSQLTDDIILMKDGINTVVGESGQTISGGQRTRLILARCFYKRPDLFILDDPLSALDMHVAEKIIQDAFLGEFKGTTRVINTSSINYLRFADLIYIMKDGSIEFKGTFHEIQLTETYKELKKISDVI